MAEHLGSFNALLTDTIENLLSKGDSPGDSATYLAEALRGLIGARTVIVLQCPTETEHTHHDPLSVYPPRRHELGNQEAVQDIARLSHGYKAPHLFISTDPGPVSIALQRLGAGSALIAPLQDRLSRVGLILLLDLLDMSGITTIMETLESLASVFALVLKNAYLYKNLEREVAVRTKDLEERSTGLSKALAEKDVMIKEIHHRVKNNLQLVSSLLFLQTDVSTLPIVREELQKSQRRIQSMALVHEELYKSSDLSSVDMHAYIRRLCEGFIDPLGLGPSISIDTCQLSLPVTQSIPCGLILNELITNAVKHAYPEGSPCSIRVCMVEEQSWLTLAVEDFGFGFSADTSEQCSGSLGLTLIRGLVDQLHGSLSIDNKTKQGNDAKGTLVRVRFKMEMPA